MMKAESKFQDEADQSWIYRDREPRWAWWVAGALAVGFCLGALVAAIALKG